MPTNHSAAAGVLSRIQQNLGSTFAFLHKSYSGLDDFAGPPKKSSKRDAEEAQLDKENDPLDDDRGFSDYFYNRYMPITENCDQIRRKINRLIDSGEVKVSDLQKALDVSNCAYYNFMRQHGKSKGSGSNVYLAAFEYFKKREAQGIKIPKKKQKTTAVADGDSKTTTVKLTTSASPGAAYIQLENEEDDAVPIFDSCDELRRKINAHLRKPGVTNALFIRDLLAQVHGPRKPASIQSAQLSRFRGQKGPVTGNTSIVYYASYVFFEKERIAAKKDKTNHRLDMEEVWLDGVNTKTNLNNVAYICRAGTSFYINLLGKPCSY